MKKHIIAFVLSVFCLSAFAQTSLQEIVDNPNKAGGVLYAYPFTGESYTAAPKGYQAFYISHFSRHGSRYLINDNEYKGPLDLLEEADKAGALTALGKDVRDRLQTVWLEARGRGGDLSPLGVRQHRGVAERMYKSFPQAFEGDMSISARSTLVTRCVLSMDAFCERMKELNPKLNITRAASHRHMPDICPFSAEAYAYQTAKDTWREEYNKFEKEHVNPDRLINSLFSDKTFVTQRVNPESLMKAMSELAGSMQNMETDLSFHDIFESQELFDLWQCKNYHNYVVDGPSVKNGGLLVNSLKPLLKDIIDSAKVVVETQGKGATLRFGHDGNLIPLLALMRFEGFYESEAQSADYYKVWSNFKAVPMATNIQLVFYRKPKSDDVLVKFLHNEKEISIPPIKTDMAPYYHWTDVEEFYSGIINE